MAKSKSGEFYSFDEVLRQLNIDENRLKRLVSEGEIRAFREGDQMKFKRSEIDTLAGRTTRGGQTSETSLTEISLEEESAPTVNLGRGRPGGLSDDLIDEPDLRERGGMRTAEISSQDTFIDQSDVGMSTEPIDFTEEGADADEVEDIGADKPASRRARPAAGRKVVLVEEKANPVWAFVLGVSAVVGIFAMLVVFSAAQGRSNSVTKGVGDMFGPKDSAAAGS